jgi:hypothetical protein
LPLQHAGLLPKAHAGRPTSAYQHQQMYMRSLISGLLVKHQMAEPGRATDVQVGAGRASYQRLRLLRACMSSAWLACRLNSQLAEQ